MSLLQTIRFAALTARLGEVSRWNPRRVERLAERRLRRLVRFAVASSSFYREKYRGIDLARFRLAELPPTNKQELSERFDDVVTDRRLRREDLERFMASPANLGRWFARRYAVSHTSGSQGLPLLIVQNRRALEIMFATMSARGNAACPGVVEGWRRLRRPLRIAVVAHERGFYPSAAAFEFMQEIVGPFVRILRVSSLDRQLVDKLNDFQPNLLVGYASVLETLALDAGALRLAGLRRVANSSEQLTARARQRIEAASGVPIVDHYATGECLLLSEGCPTHGGAHVNSDWALLEVVDEDSQPVPPGATGKKVLLTNLANTAQPFIRYEIADRVTMADTPCDCGSRLPRIARIDGRAAELFWIDDDLQAGYRPLSGVLFHSAADSLGGVREWRALQTERNRVEMQLELVASDHRPFEHIERRLVARLHELGLPAHVAVDVESVIGLLPDRITGKFRRMISHVGPPQDPLRTHRSPAA